MRFRKKPIVIDAEQFWPDRKPWPAGVNPQPCNCANLAQDGRVCELHKADGRRYGIIHTLEGEMIVSPGDWVITGVAGEKYACKDSIFKRTYEPAPDIMKLIEEAKASFQGKRFMDMPEVWIDEGYFWCESGHRSRTILKCDGEGDRCLECRKPVRMGPKDLPGVIPL